MFGISFEELLVLMVLALILFGPEKLPEYAEKMGRWVARMRQASQEVRDSYQTGISQTFTTTPPSSPAWGYCVHCGKSLEKDFVFCPYCGRRQREEPPAPYHAPERPA
ncbi:MAG: zinc-ribbon domain-containing protein [Deltaproteobacteria bacterium]|nr:zinc-ribbon domain-containing protein [Deltaproteobacteria bacterium]